MIKRNPLSVLRQLKGMKQQQLAKQLGITQQALSKLEQKETIAMEKWEEILAALKITHEEWKQLQKIFTPPPPVKIFK